MEGFFSPPPGRESLGERIHVCGNSCSGKSTLAAALSELRQLPLVELDALNWQAGWISLNDTDPDRFDELVVNACRGDKWVVAGSYSRSSQAHIWPRVQTILWLDLPRWQLVYRVIIRTWQRSRSSELLWGKLQERFIPLLKVWQGEQSLLWWIWTQHARKRAQMQSLSRDERFSHIRFVRFKSSRQLERWLQHLDSR